MLISQLIAFFVNGFNIFIPLIVLTSIIAPFFLFGPVKLFRAVPFYPLPILTLDGMVLAILVFFPQAILDNFSLLIKNKQVIKNFIEAVLGVSLTVNTTIAILFWCLFAMNPNLIFDQILMNLTVPQYFWLFYFHGLNVLQLIYIWVSSEYLIKVDKFSSRIFLGIIVGVFTIISLINRFHFNYSPYVFVKKLTAFQLYVVVFILIFMSYLINEIYITIQINILYYLLIIIDYITYYY